MSLYMEAIAAATLTDAANNILGNGSNCSWSADDWRDFASSLAAEEGVTGICPMCRTEVHANSSARIATHRNKIGQQCGAAGQWFYIAVVAS